MPERLLDHIDSPEDLRRLPESDLPALCREIREYLVEVVSAKGGHFAPNLGVVDLTVALHYALDTPRDKIIWDVGHQSYPHKVLTGRREALRNVKQYGGISGYPRIDESPYDHFGVGHASTSISAALGMAVARDLRGEDYRIVTVTGDGAMTGGIALEGLNNAGASRRDLTVVLNDNRMAIARNVGAISQYLTGLTTHPTYNAFKRFVRTVFKRFPLGLKAHKLANRMEAALKHFLVPGALFEAMGFRYFGPIDGHDMPELVKVLRNLASVRGPALLHVVTKKGKGYQTAEEKPETWHGVTPFLPETAEFIKSPGAGMSYSTAFGRTLVELAGEMEDLVGITAAMAAGTGLNLLEEAYPDRFFDVGIAEQHAVTYAAGLAAAGLRPVVAIYSTFLQRGFDQVLHDVALQKLPVVFALDRAGLVGEDGATQHGAFDISYLRMIPNLIVTAPKDALELRNLLYTGLVQRELPFTVRYPRDSTGLEQVGPGRFEEVPIGSWEVLREGRDVWFLAVGAMVPVALEAAEILRDKGPAPGVVNCRFIKPMDEALLARLAAGTRLLVTLEEGALPCGFGAGVEEHLGDRFPEAAPSVLRLGIPDRFVTHGSRRKLLEEVGLVPEAVAKAVAERLGNRPKAASSG